MLVTWNIRTALCTLCTNFDAVIQIAPGHTVARHRGCGAWRLPPPLLQLLHRRVGMYRDSGDLSRESFVIPYSHQGGGGCSLWSPACLESFRCTYYTTPSVGWDIQEVRFHCNFSFRPLLLQSEKLCNEIKLLIDRKIWTMIKFSNHGAISTWYSFSKFTLQSVVSTICNLPKI